MDPVSLAAVAVALAMDAFAVSIVAGFSLERMTGRHVFRLAFHFGLFQALMPVIGWAGGVAVYEYIAAFDHWIAFGLLAIVGGKMIVGVVLDKEDERVVIDPTAGWRLVALSIATSIDALAVGLSLAMVGSTIAVPAVVIGVVACGFTACGMLLGRRIGTRWGKPVEVVGGLILIAIGVKILIEHLGQ